MSACGLATLSWFSRAQQFVCIGYVLYLAGGAALGETRTAEIYISADADVSTTA